MNIRRSWHIRRTLRKQGSLRGARRSASGQAMVELALAATFLSLLFAAAIDLGIAYKTYQTLINATAEATTYLTLNPIVSCGNENCIKTSADREARNRFRTEQGSILNGSASALDLDGNKVDDLGEHGWSWVEQRVLIDEADSTQITTTNNKFAVGSTFSRTSNADCLQRKSFDSLGRQCFIVVRSVMIYHPFVLVPIIGRDMTIRSIAVKPIVNGVP